MCGEVSEEVYFVEDILTDEHCKEQSCDGKCRSMRRTFRQTLREAVMLLWMEPLSWEAEDGEISEGISDYVNDRDDHILCLEDDELFPRGISNELLS